MTLTEIRCQRAPRKNGDRRNLRVFYDLRVTQSNPFKGVNTLELKGINVLPPSTFSIYSLTCISVTTQIMYRDLFTMVTLLL